MEEHFTAFYNGKESRFYIQPVAHMPLYVVTFTNEKLLSDSNTALLSCISVIIFLQTFLIFLSAILIQAFRVRFNKSGFRNVELSWLKPSLKNEEKYKQHIWLYSFMMLFQIVFAKPISLLFSSHPDDTLFTTGIIITYSILAVGFSFYLIGVKGESGKETQGTRSVFPLAGISLLYLFILLLFSINLWKMGVGFFFNFLCTQAIAFLVLGYLETISKKSKALFYVVIEFIFKNIINPIFKKSYSKETLYYKWKYYYYFAFLLFVVLTGVIPASKMFEQCYNQEIILITKKQQLHLAQSVWQQKDTAHINLNHYSGKYYQNFIADKLYYSIPENCFNNSSNPPSKSFSWLYSYLRPSFNQNSKAIESLVSNQSFDKSFQWTINKKTITLHAINTGTEGNKLNIDTLTIESSYQPIRRPGKNFLPGTNTKEPLNIYILLFYTGIPILLLMLFILMREFLRRVFFPPASKVTGDQSDYLKTTFADLNYQNLLMVGIPDSGKGSTVEKILQPYSPVSIDLTKPLSEKNKILIESYLKSDEEKKSPVDSKRYFICKNFEYCFHDKEQTEKKLNLLEDLLRLENCTIVLLSSTQQLPFIDEYLEIMNSGITGATEDEKNKNEEKLKTAILNAERWMNVMNNFQIFYYRWQDENGKTYKPSADIIENECNHSDFLFNLKAQLRMLYKLQDSPTQKELDEAKDDLEIKLSQIASFYYDSIWLSLSKPERKVLYDFSKDGLVNHGNTHEISILIQKGIFICENEQMSLMNNSFRNYMLTRVNKEDIQEIEADEIEKGSWNKMRDVIIAVILIAGAFIFITQQEALNSLTAYLSAFSGGIFALLNIMNKIPGGAK
jgi:hypothetical protein